jgi:hypothetical protein
MYSKVIAAIALTFSLMATSARADGTPIFRPVDNYVFVKGKGVEVCEAYYKNLTAYRAEEIACERKFRPELVDFKKPVWRNLDIAKNKDLAIKIFKFTTWGDQFKVDPDLDKEKNENRGHFNNAYMLIASVDIDNDSRPENVLLYDDGGCVHAAHVYWKPLLVLNDEMDLVDAVRTKPLLPEPIIGDKNNIKNRVAVLNYEIYDVFYYKDKVYYDRWSLAGANKIYVNQLRGLNNSVVCIYKIKWIPR